MLKSIIFFAMLFCNALAISAQGGSVCGSVNRNEIPMKDAIVFIPDLRLGSTTDKDGNFCIHHIPPASYELIAIYTGCDTFAGIITIKDTERVDLRITLQETSAALTEVTVTGVSKATLINENPVPVATVSNKVIQKTNENNIIDALTKNVSGLNAVKTGPNISKPFIRGLGYNRVLVLYDGVRQEGQQWGDEHGIEVDAYNIEKAEVVKGPASLMYGSDALAGVISLMPFIPKEKDGKVRGKFTSEFQSNNGLSGNGLRVNYSGAHWLWAVRGSYRIAKNYTNKIDGRVYNTGFDEKNFTALLGYQSGKSYSHLNFTLYDNLQGIPDGSRDSLSRKFTKQVFEAGVDDIFNRPLVTGTELSSYKLSPLHQHIQHYRIYNNSHLAAGKGELDINSGFQQNTRREYNHPAHPAQAGLFVQLNTVNYGIKYHAPKIVGTEISVGVNGMYQDNKNRNGTNFPIPDYNLFDLGTFLYGKWQKNKITVSGGVRYDLRLLNGKDFYVRKDSANGFSEHVNINDTTEAYLQFPSLEKKFTGLSMSMGMTYKLNEKINFKTNIARAYRAPNITELASNGLDPGAHIVYLGNRSFSPEFSLQEDIGVSAKFKNVSGEISLFNNNISNYIYLSQLTDAAGNSVVLVPGNSTYQYQNSSAQLYGLDGTFSIHPQKWRGFSFNNNFALVYGFNRKKEFKGKGIYGEYLPFIPPVKILSALNYEIKTKSKKISSVTTKIEAEYNGKQTRFRALNKTESFTSSFTLINLGIGCEITCFKTSVLQLQLQVNNVMDAAWQSNLSRLKYFEYYSQSPNGRYGIYGMGRNFCVKIILPFN